MPSKKAMEIAEEWASRYQYPWPKKVDRQKEIRMLATLIDSGVAPLVETVGEFTRYCCYSAQVMVDYGKNIDKALEGWEVE